jgi:CHASE2 domain-containing sensor protein
MLNNFRIKLREELVILRVGLIPGLTVIALLIIARMTGTLQFLEWTAFDKLLRLRPEEIIDERVIIVGINEADIREIKKYPVPDKELARLINKLQIYQPRVIGLDIIRDLPVPAGHDELVATFKNSKNLIGVEKALPQEINPPPSLPPSQIGFIDAITDIDGVIRRSLLRTPTKKQGYKFSLTLRLAEEYLKAENISIEHIIDNGSALRLKGQNVPRFFPNSGGYVNTDDGGFQALINYRQSRFRVLSLADIKKNNFSQRWIRDRIVIIGVMSPGVDTKNVPAMKFSQAGVGLVYGVEIQAHAVSQIVSTALDGRPLINTWTEGWEYVWIIGWGLLAIMLARLTASPLSNFLAVGIGAISIGLISYGLLILGWWIPLVPTILVFILNGIAITALYQYDKALRLRIKERQDIIEYSYTMIHNGPLQTLGTILQHLREEVPENPILSKMEHLNKEIRGVYDYLERESVRQNQDFHIVNGQVINLKDPIHSVLYQVYTYTLERDLLHFKTLNIRLPNFQQIDNSNLTTGQKLLLCQFLEEALCNVGKHAKGVKRLKVSFTQERDKYILAVIDNGAGITSNKKGHGTEDFETIAHKLKGEFQRFSSPEDKHTVCQLSVPIPRNWLEVTRRLMTM